MEDYFLLSLCAINRIKDLLRGLVHAVCLAQLFHGLVDFAIIHSVSYFMTKLHKMLQGQLLQRPFLRAEEDYDLERRLT